MGRVPKATISFTYCMARAELKDGGGLVSKDFGEASLDADTSFGAITASFSRAHAANVIPKTRQKIAASLKLLPKVIAPSVLRALSVVSDAPGMRCRYSPCIARPW